MKLLFGRRQINTTELSYATCDRNRDCVSVIVCVRAPALRLVKSVSEAKRCDDYCSTGFVCVCVFVLFAHIFMYHLFVSLPHSLVDYLFVVIVCAVRADVRPNSLATLSHMPRIHFGWMPINASKKSQINGKHALLFWPNGTRTTRYLLFMPASSRLRVEF